MKKFSIIAVLVALFSLAAAVSASAADQVPRTEPKQWKIQRASALAGETTAMSNSEYGLSNGAAEGWLSYDFSSDSTPFMKGKQWQFVAYWEFIKRDAQANVRDHRPRAVEAGEKVGLLGRSRQYKTSRGTRTGEYLVSSGNGVKWTRDRGAAYEWVVEIDQTTHRLSLYNTKSKRFLGLPSGGTAGWITPASQPTQGQTHDSTVTLTAQPPVSGFIPFLGFFGGGPGNTTVLTEVRNTMNGPYLSFIKRGHSSNECGNASAVIQLGPGAALTPAQMTELYGSATPSLANQATFLVCAATNANSVFLNIKWRDA